MTCNVSEEQLWSWIDRNVPELEEHLAVCARCRARAEEMRGGIETIAVGSAQPSVPLPEKIGSYVIKRLLGEGGQALVYEAEQPSPRRPVALKVLKGGRLLGEHHIRHFRRESQALASLKHPGIATIYEAGRTEEGQHFFAMELVAGVSLDAYVREQDVPLEKRLELFRQVCEAVHYAHQHGVIHRDLKPSNILIDAQGNPKILDFGLARITDADVTLTTTASGIGQIVGTLRYMSPEQARGEPGQIDVPSDIYSLGVILYELLTDQRPYDVSKSIPEAVTTVCEQAPRRPSAFNRALRGDLETIVLKALEKEPSRRYQSVEELSEDVRRYVGNEPVLAKPPGAVYLLRKKLRRHRLRIALGVAILLLGAIALWGQSWWQDRSLERQRAERMAAARGHAMIIQANLEAGRVEEYLGSARELFKQHPELPEALLVDAQALFRAAQEAADDGLMSQAVFTLRRALESDPSQWTCAALLAEIYHSTGDSRAGELQTQADREAPDTAEAWYLRSFTTLDLHTARQYAKEALKRDARHDLALARLAHLCRLTKDVDCAIRAAQELVDLERDPARWRAFQGRVLTRERRYQEAVQRFTRAIACTPNDLELYWCRGVAYFCLGDYVSAVKDYSHALDPSRPQPRTDTWVRYKRATPLWMMGRLEDAAADYHEFRELLGRTSYADARRVLVLHDRARLLRQEGRAADAEKTREEANTLLEAARSDTTSGIWLQAIFECLGGECTPEELVAAADRTNPEQVCEGYYYAAEACLMQDRIDEARKWFQKCVETDLVFDPDTPNDPMNEYHLARWRLEQLGADTGAYASPEEE